MTANSGGSPLTPLERATSLVFGIEAGTPPLRLAGHQPPRAVIEEVVTEAFARPPVIVSFSGGRDSSAVLALATKAARRLGAPAPVPVTLRFRRYADTHESTWQELVVRHLGLQDWVRLDLDHELDVLGPYNRRILRRHGILWPPNAHFHAPVFEAAQGGTVLTGAGGDEILTSHRWRRAALVLSRQSRPQARDLLRTAHALSPDAVRRGVLWWRGYPVQPCAWLRPAAARAVSRQAYTDFATEPWRWDRWVTQRWWPCRYRLLGANSLSTIAADLGVRVAHPLMDERVLAAMARHFGPAGFEGRTQVMSLLFGDLLPETTRARSTKASFNPVFFNRHARAFVAGWDGGGVDTRLVSPAALHREWTRDGIDMRTLTLLMSAWLSAPRG